ncbi:Fe-S cluster assembly sulfur transfer protein SufU [Compostimonas suwonensis]|uniref:Nitrogen fixation NifU-like protein n=1 Tax=Compostimonas suwonensis TaxID=1048394 RepID=A0A2M9BWL2_9MICO|nr:SUF system NifU family Fe-S cluster assembly protein [Compostimonas suwonensis]PJJ62314.1 nitrogen fixation NifU-like protein [Compostimonas suwonensis]
MTGEALSGLYQEIIMDHSRRPHGVGLKPSAAAESHQINPTCGDEITLQLQVDGGRIVQASWEGHGCAISQSSASMLSDLVVDLDPAEVTEKITAFRELMHSKGTLEGDEEVLGDAVAFAGTARYVARVKCAMLAWVALEDALTRVGPR